MGAIMVVYSLAEIGFSLKFDSLVIFSDGLHNLSDGVALAGLFSVWTFLCLNSHVQALCNFLLAVTKCRSDEDYSQYFFIVVSFWAEQKKMRFDHIMHRVTVTHNVSQYFLQSLFWWADVRLAAHWAAGWLVQRTFPALHGFICWPSVHPQFYWIDYWQIGWWQCLLHHYCWKRYCPQFYRYDALHANRWRSRA
jgi:hypothetical protein